MFTFLGTIFIVLLHFQERISGSNVSWEIKSGSKIEWRTVFCMSLRWTLFKVQEIQLEGQSTRQGYLKSPVKLAAHPISSSAGKEAGPTRIRHRFGSICADQLLNKNQIYAEDRNFIFAEKFIKGRSPKTKKPWPLPVRAVTALQERPGQDFFRLLLLARI